MGASALQPVLTRHTQVSRVNVERMRANVIEAAEQCGILSLAAVAEPIALDRFLEKRETRRLLVFCDEAADIGNPIEALQQGLTADRRDRRRDRPRGRICRGGTGAAAAAAQDAAAVVGPPHPARGYRRRRRAGAGAGRAGGLAGTGLANRPRPSRLSHRPLSQLANPCRNAAPAMLRPAPTRPLEPRGTPNEPWNPVFPDIWT